jgi:DNA-binding response OmpR family regulator
VLRRAGHGPEGRALRVRDVEIETDAVRVRRAGELVPMTPTEFRLLVDLAEHAGSRAAATRCSRRSGATAGAATRGSSTCTSRGSARSSAPT